MSPTRHLPHGLRAVALALAIALPCSTALAQAAGDDPPRDGGDDTIAIVEELSQKGTEEFSQGRYNEAIALFKKAYALSPVGTLLYNTALCYDRLKDPENARIHYEEFILAPDAEPDIRARALARIKEIEKARRGAGVGVITDKGEGKGEGKGEEKGKGEDKDEGLGSKTIAGIVTSSLGVVLIGGGAIFGTLVVDEIDTFDASRSLDDKKAAQKSAQDKALTADILYIGGAAAVITGAVLIALDMGQEEKPEGARWTPWVGPGTLGAAFEIPLGVP